MKKTLIRILTGLACGASVTLAVAQSTAFTYQGRLNYGTNGPANGRYDLLVVDFSAPTGGSSTAFNIVTNIPVSNGLFTVTLDLGEMTFPGADRWLELGVRTNGFVGGFTTLSPRQQVTSTPYAIRARQFSGMISNTQLSGTYSGPVTFANASNVFTGTFTGSGAGLTNLSAWQLGGNAGTAAGVNFIGTTDNQPLEFKVFGQRALRIELGGTNGPNLIGGVNNEVGTLVGGGATIGNGYGNSIGTNSDGGTIGGGVFNRIAANSPFAIIAGASGNSIGTNSGYSTISGGYQNNIGPNSPNSTISGGTKNAVWDGYDTATIAGGADNFIVSSGGAIGGGRSNYVWAIAEYATIGGGSDNSVDLWGEWGTISGGKGNHFSWATGAVIGGGENNRIGGGTLSASPFSSRSTIGGGYGNWIRYDAEVATIAGGKGNTVQEYASYSTIGGGSQNGIGTNAELSTIAGGDSNAVGVGANRAVVGGGAFNQANAASVTVAGGYANIVNAGTSTISGGQNNTIDVGASSAFIGGGYHQHIGQGAFYAAIAGGNYNDIQDSSSYATIAGGDANLIMYSSGRSVIGGGGANIISNSANYVSIVGGQQNKSGIATHWSSVGGGYANRIGNFSEGATIAGGYQNQVTNSASYATVPGGQGNLAGAAYTFAAGRQAKALHQGSFIWGDSTASDVNSAANNDFTVRASGGVRFFSNSTTNAGVSLAPGGTSWAVISDRNAKKDFASINAVDILEKLSAMPITQWRYNWENTETTPHIGPMAQDFKHAFYPGSDDKSITTLEADGVAFAAIQGLNEKLEARSQQSEVSVQKLQVENAELKARLEKLERLMTEKNGGGK